MRSYSIIFFFRIQIQTYLSSNLLFKSHQDELQKSREGSSRKSNYGGVIRDAMVLSCGIEHVSSRNLRYNLCKSRNSPAWP